MSLSVQNIYKTYNKKIVLNDISFSAKEGEIVGLLGPNGAGKSTLMKIITGYAPADRGAVKVCGTKVDINSIEHRKKIGYLPEHNPLYQDMYVTEYLQYVGKLYNIKNIKDRIDSIISQTGLKDEQHKKISQLSKGYRQRVGLAQAIIHKPDLLILDEPTTGLDPNQIFEIRELISKWGENHTVIFSTHILQEVVAICHKVILINKGTFITELNKEEISLERLEKEFLSIKN